MKNIIFICQKVDEQDPILGFLVTWLRKWADHPEVGRLVVLTLSRGRYQLPDKVEVVAIKGGNRWQTLKNFYRQVFKYLRQTNYFLFIWAALTRYSSGR